MYVSNAHCKFNDEVGIVSFFGRLFCCCAMYPQTTDAWAVSWQALSVSPLLLPREKMSLSAAGSVQLAGSEQREHKLDPQPVRGALLPIDQFRQEIVQHVRTHDLTVIH